MIYEQKVAELHIITRPLSVRKQATFTLKANCIILLILQTKDISDKHIIN